LISCDNWNDSGFGSLMDAIWVSPYVVWNFKMKTVQPPSSKKKRVQIACTLF
jgi:hypothetical protein